MALGTGEWIIKGQGQEFFRVKIAYDATSEWCIFKDFRQGPKRITALASPAIPLVDFLKQFEDIDARWEGFFESETVDLIKICAQLQADLLLKISPSLTPVPDVSELIASSLRFLVLSHEAYLVQSFLPRYPFRNKSTWDSSKEIINLSDNEPNIEVTRIIETQQADTATLSADDKADLTTIIHDLVRTMQYVLFRRNPQEWPALLCSLCMLHLGSEEFCDEILASAFAEGHKAITEIIDTLCVLFDICSKRLHPLSDDWNEEEYARIVGHDQILIECFQWFSDEWHKGK